MDPAAPHAFPRRLLLMVTGRTPQVVTETLYALCVKQHPAFIPTEVHLITTAEGAQDARLALLAEPGGWFFRLCGDYGLDGIRFTPEHIHLIPGADGAPAQDIRSEAEHQACADLVTETVRRFTAEPDTALHVSLAGGRKTMTYYLGNALTLFGRPQDRLSHVLVPPPYESNREFFYPTPDSRPLFVDPLQRWFDARDAQVTLAEIPFVRLRDGLPRRFKTLESGGARFSEVVAAMQEALRPAAVEVLYVRRCIRIADGREVPLSPASLAFYGWIARRTKAGEPVLPPRKRKPSADHYRAFLHEAELADARDTLGGHIKVGRAMTREYWNDRKGQLRRELEQTLGPLAAAYDVTALSHGRPACYGLAIEPERIRIWEQ
jgi:CRISPR-associated protein (TIGR02584 family)